MSRAVRALSIAVLALCLGGLLATAAVAQSGKLDSDVNIVNRSKWDIYHLYLSSSSEDEWGPDQLGDHVLRSGGSFLLTDIPCDEYDLLLIDEDGDECVLVEVDLCADDDSWVITSDDLLDCEGYG